MKIQIPPLERRAMLQRLAVVWGFAALIGLALWSTQGFGQGLGAQMVYSFAISTFIWFFTDVVGYVLFCKDGTRWPEGWTRHIFLTTTVVLGYVLGTAVGDWYGGWSTWELLRYEPNRFIGMTIMSLAISVGFISYFYQKEKASQAHHQATEARLTLLQSQLDPHMLFNTLANLRALIAVDPARATHMLDRLNDYLRSTLNASRATEHSLSAEFDRLRDYLELMQIRMGPRLRYQLDLPTALASVPVPPLILQSLVENCIVHGLEPQVEGGSVTVCAHQDGAMLVLQVTDTGMGFDAQQTAEGFGITQVRERLATRYGNLATMHLIAAYAIKQDSKAQKGTPHNTSNASSSSNTMPTSGTCAVLRIPLTSTLTPALPSLKLP
jgi:Histidine kinase